MVFRTFTIAAFLAVAAGVGAAKAQIAGGASARAVARATILRSVVLRVGVQLPRLELAMQAGSTVAREPMPNERPCDGENAMRCTLFIFDLP
jgi:hypothetical protein